MQVVYARCAGLDVHQKTVSACISVCGADGNKRQQVREFGTFTRDCEWIADLLQHGLLKGSFVPPTEIQDLRDLTRYRAELRQSQNRVANRLQKFLEQANLKLSSVASDALGVSGRRMLEAIIAGQDNAEQLAQLARGRLKSKVAELEQALAGQARDHHRLLLDEWKAFGERIKRIEAGIDKRIRPFEQAVALWQTIPGVDRVTACNLVAEIGVDMKQFPTAQHLASWAALCLRCRAAPGRI
jgi:transposase